MHRTPFLTDILLYQQGKMSSNKKKQFIFDLSDVPELDIFFVNQDSADRDRRIDINPHQIKTSVRPKDQIIPEKFREIKKVTITKKDLRSLGYHSWVNDEVINSYLTHLHNTHIETNIGYTNTFFYVTLKRSGNEYANTWGGIRGNRVDIFSHFLIPITTGAHWFLIDLDFDNQVMLVYDSLSHQYSSYTKKIADFLTFQGIPPIKIVYPAVPKQTTHYDCGVFLMKFATMIYENQPIEKNSFHQKDITSFRTKVKEILSKYISEK